MRARSHDGMLFTLSRPVEVAPAPTGCIWTEIFLVRTTGSSPGACDQAGAENAKAQSARKAAQYEKRVSMRHLLQTESGTSPEDVGAVTSAPIASRTLTARERVLPGCACQRAAIALTRSQYGQLGLVGWQVKQPLFDAMFCTALLLLPLDRLFTDAFTMAVNWLEWPLIVTSPTLDERFWLA